MPSSPKKPLKKNRSAPNPVKLTVDDALGRLEYGRFHVRLILMASVTTFADAMSTMVSFFFPQAVQPDWALTDVQTASITAILFIGSFVGVIVANCLGDSMGRRVTFMAFLSGVAPNFRLLMLFRFGVGFGLGGTTVPFYALAEWVPHQRRAHSLLKLGFAWSLGTFLVPLIAIPTIDDKDLWPVLLYACAAPSVLSLLVGYLFLPESPRWLLSKGHNDMALAVLREASVVNHQDPWLVCPQSAHLMRGGKTKSKWKAIGRLFRKEWRRMIICLIPTFLVVDFLYFTYVQMIHMALSDTDGDEDQFAFFEIALTSIAELIATFVAIIAIDRIGRVPTQAIGYFAGALTILGLCLGRHFMAGTGKVAATSFLFYLAFAARFFIMAATNVTWVHTVEILPKKIRSTFHSTAHALASLGAAASCYHMVSVNVSFLVIGIVVAVISIGTSLLTCNFPETKTLSMGNLLSRALSSDGAGAFAVDSTDVSSILSDSSRTTSSSKASVSRV